MLLVLITYEQIFREKNLIDKPQIYEDQDINMKT